MTGRNPSPRKRTSPKKKNTATSTAFGKAQATYGALEAPARTEKLAQRRAERAAIKEAHKRSKVYEQQIAKYPTPKRSVAPQHQMQKDKTAQIEELRAQNTSLVKTIARLNRELAALSKAA